MPYDIKQYSPNWRDDDFTYGIEFECIAPRHFSSQPNRVATLLNRVLPAYHESARGTNYTDHTISTVNWKVKNDSSVRLNGGQFNDVTYSDRGIEVITPVMSKSFNNSSIPGVLRLLNEKGFVVNHTCGLHVHFGAASFFRKLVRNKETSFNCLASRAVSDVNRHGNLSQRLAWLVDSYQEFEPCFDMLVPYNRRESHNDYTASVRNNRYAPGWYREQHDFNTVCNHLGRRVKLNLTCALTQGTIEVRHFGGTLNALKVATWVWLMGKFIHVALMSPVGQQNRNRRFLDLFYKLKADKDADGRNDEVKMFLEYLRERARMFSRFEGIGSLQDWL